MKNNKIARIREGDFVAYAFDADTLHHIVYYVDREEHTVHLVAILSRPFVIPEAPPRR